MPAKAQHQRQRKKLTLADFTAELKQDVVAPAVMVSQRPLTQTMIEPLIDLTFPVAGHTTL